MVPYLVHHFVERAARERPAHAFLIEGNETTTYAALDHAAEQMARGLLARGVERGDRVGLLAPNSRFYVQAYFAILEVGAVVVPLNTGTTAEVLAQTLVDCDARVLIAATRTAKLVSGIVAAASTLRLVIMDGPLPAAQAAAAESSRIDRLTVAELGDGDAAALAARKRAVIDLDLASIIYTSGSTGRPRGAMLSHRNIVANVSSIVTYLELTPSDRVLAILPFYYVYGMSVLNTHAAVGATVVIENRFAYPNVALDTLEAQACTGFSGVPSTYSILLNRSNLRERRLEHLRYVTQAGGAMSPDVTRRLMEALPRQRIFIMYGATEASARLTYLPPEDLARKLGSVGKAIPNVDVRVLRVDGSEAAPGELGEIVARGSNIMRGYWGDPEETARVLDDAGYHTGDLARRDEDGYLFIEGRKSDMIKVGAHRVSAKTVEEAILGFAEVEEAAVIGVPDEILIEALRAFVVFRDPTTVNVRALEQHLARKLPTYAVPTDFQICAELPKNESGKIMKQLLRAPKQVP